MPLNLVLVRHGESEGNVAGELRKSGRENEIPKEFYKRHCSSWRLTSKGEQQAITAGAWIRTCIAPTFGRYYVSSYVRAVETAYRLQLPNALWYKDLYLREREWGDLDIATQAERNTIYAQSLYFKKTEPFFWIPPNGESMAQLCLRVDRIIDTLHRECSQMNVIIVCHGEVMWAFDNRLQRMSEQTYNALDASQNPHDRIHNCQIIHYTRVCPEGKHAGAIASHLDWRRSVCPWDIARSANAWQSIVRSKYTNDELLQSIGLLSRIID